MSDSVFDIRTRQIKRVLWITLFLNLFVCVSKLAYGYATDTLGMVADGYHSLFDSSSNVVGLIAIQYASKPADTGHPYGHRKAETISTLIIAAMLFGACYEIGSGAYARFFDKTVPEVTLYSFLIMIGTMVINYGVSRYEGLKGRELRSQILMADSAHTRSDIFVSLSVIIALIGIKLGYVWLDGVAAIVIAVFVAFMGFRVIRESLGTLMDQAQLDPKAVCESVSSIAGVRDCHNVRSRGHSSAIYMDLNIHVDPAMTIQRAHELTHQVIAKIKTEFPQVIDVVVHTEPNLPGHN